jgi:putative nucleotidyltransferase with HDIG domain
MKLSMIEKTIETIRELPTLPLVAHKISMILQNPKSSVSDLTKIVEKDQSLAAKVLKLVNSAHYGLPQRVTNINQAIALLGYKNISYIVMTISVFETLRHVKKHLFDRRKFWVHSIAVALMSIKLAKECEYVLIDDIFTAGLLHDLGKVFMDGFLHEEFEAIIERAQKDTISFIEAEHRLFDIDHTMVGEWIARTWGLPLHVIAGIKHHHQEVEKRKGLSLSSESFIDIIRVADIGVKMRQIGNSGDGQGQKSKLDVTLFKRLPIDKGSVKTLLDELEKDLHKSEILLDLAL